MPRLKPRVITDRLFARIDASLVAPLRRELLERIDGVAIEQRSHTDNRAGAIERRLDIVEARLADAQRRINGVAEHLPFLLDRLSTTNAMNRDARRRLENVEALAGRVGEVVEDLGRLETRTEFIRREFMHELRYGGRPAGATPGVETRIVDGSGLLIVDDAVTGAAEGPLRVNLGAGHVGREGYVNVDARAVDGIAVVADVRALPFAPGSVDEFYASHLAEHFPEEDLRRAILPHWLELLRPGGLLRLIVPDAEAMLAEHAAGRYSFDDLRLVTFGEQEYDGDFHFNMFSREGIAELLVASGFSEPRLVADTRRNGACYEMEIRAERPHKDEEGALAAPEPDEEAAEAHAAS